MGMNRLRLTRAAATDLKELFTYTLERYGHKKAIAYRDGIFHALRTIREHPHIGSDQNGIRPNTRRLVVQSHAIYYQMDDSSVLVTRILGPGQDPLEEL